MEIQKFTYPCQECDSNTLLPLGPEYPTLCECEKCGHPQDMPSKAQIIELHTAEGIFPASETGYDQFSD